MASKPKTVPQDTFVLVVLDQEYKVTFGTRTLARLEESFGKPLYDIAVAFIGEPDAGEPDDASKDADRINRVVRTYRIADVLKFLEAVIPGFKGDPTPEQLAAAWPLLLSGFVGAFNRLFAGGESVEKKGAPSSASEPGPSPSSDSAAASSTN